MILVEIQNFQAIEHLKFEIDGFTTIIGQSNIGKSSIVRALRCALTGAEGVWFVRHNPKTCSRVLKGVKSCGCSTSVRLDFGGGKAVLWTKGDNVNQYQVWEPDKPVQVYDSVGRSPELPKLLESFTTILIGRDKVLTQIADQFNPLFLIDADGSCVADVLSDVAKLDEVNVALKLVTKDRKGFSSTRSVREKDIKTTEAELRDFDGLEGALAKGVAVQKRLREVQDRQSLVARLEGFSQNLMSGAREIQQLLKATKGSISELSGVQAKTETTVQIARFREGWNSRVQLYKHVASVLEKFRVSPFSPLDEAFLRYQKLNAWFVGLTKVISLVKRYGTLPEFQYSCSVLDLKAGLEHTQTVSRYDARQARLAATVNTLENQLQKAPVVSMPSGLKESQRRLTDLLQYTTQYRKLESLVAETQDEVADLVAEETSILQEFEALGVCPVCSQPVTPHRLLCG